MDPAQAPVLGVGELLWDRYAERRLPGGAPANVVFHAARFGHPAWLASCVGDDEEGRDLRAELASHGLSVELVQTDPRRPTGWVTVDTRDPANPSYTIHRDVAWEAIRSEAALLRRAREASAVCVGTLAQRGARSRETIRHCLDAAGGAWRVYDVNLRRDGYHKEWIEATLQRVHAVKLNVDEAAELAAMLQLAAGPPARFGREMIDRYGFELVCVTKAEHGCALVTADEVVEAPGREVPVADSVGAGDAFTAALISARLRGWNLRRTAHVANEVGALVASRSGAMPDLAREIAALVEDHGAEQEA